MKINRVGENLHLFIIYVNLGFRFHPSVKFPLLKDFSLLEKPPTIPIFRNMYHLARRLQAKDKQKKQVYTYKQPNTIIILNDMQHLIVLVHSFIEALARVLQRQKHILKKNSASLQLCPLRIGFYSTAL